MCDADVTRVSAEGFFTLVFPMPWADLLQVVTTEEGQQLANELGTPDFFETSAKDNVNVDVVFDSILDAIILDPAVGILK